MKEVKCLGCGQSYQIRVKTLVQISNESLSPEGYCALVGSRVGFVLVTNNGVSD